MLSKTKKIALLTTGLVGALVTSSAVGVALSSCTTNNTSTEVEDNTKYNTYINWSDPNALTNLVVDGGIVYSDIYKTTIIAITPSFTNTTITIPASVRAITGYTEVLPSGATIVRGAFQPSASYTPQGGEANSTQNGVTLPNVISTVKFAPNSQLKSIGAKAFSGCTLLESIDLPTTVTMIGDNAFNGCNLLKSINLTNVEYVGQSAFAGLASSLISPKISISLNKAVVIGQNAFQNANIETVDFSANTSLISLGNYAFDGCSSLTGTIDLSKATSLTSTGQYTFQNCSSITAVNLPSSLITIGNYAFNGCSSIANTIDLSGANRLTTIGNSAFSGCTKLTGLSYPTSAPITTFGTGAFSGCSALTQLGSVANTFTAPAALTTIAGNAFSGTAITTVDISNMSATEPFQNSALAGMTSLTTVKFNNAITTLPQTLFSGDTSLKTIKLPSSITTITGGTSTNTNISTFYGSNLETVDMSEITSYSTTNALTTIVPAYLFVGLTSLKNVVLKTGTTAIENNAFQGTSGLISVKEASQTGDSYNTGYTTTDTLTTIGDYAFQGTGLTSFVVTALNTNSESSRATSSSFSLGNNIFQGATKLTSIDLENATGLVTIPQFAFGGTTALTSIKFPSAAKAENTTLTLNEGAFSNVPSLKEVNLNGYTNVIIYVNNFTNANSLSTIDLSSLTTNPTFISSSSESAVFTGLPSSATVKLGNAINAIANPAVFTQSRESDTQVYTRVSLQYPNGIIFSSSGDGSQINSGILSGVSTLLNNVSGPLDLSSNSSLTSIGANTLFGNTNITSLTLSASNISSNINLYTLASNVNAINPVSPSDTNQYTISNVPLGNNDSLKNINFDKFVLSNNVVGPSGLTQNAFNAIVKIMNSYAYYAPSQASVYTETLTASDLINFKSWANDNNAWIDQDAQMTIQTDSSQGTCTITLQNITTEPTITNNNIVLSNGTSVNYVLTHNSIKWNLSYDGQTQLLTLTTDPNTTPNIYRGNANGTDLQVYIKANSDGSINLSGVQVSMSIKLLKASTN